MKKAAITGLVIMLGAVLCAQSIVVKSPNGGEAWRKGTTHDITWDAAGISAGTFKITLWRGGANLGVIAANLTWDKRSFPWTVGTLAGGAALQGSGYSVKVRLQEQPVSDTSNGTFSITPEIQLANPPGVAQLDRPQFDIYRSPKLEIRELSYNYSRKKFEAWVKNTGNEPFVGHFRWTWVTYCGSRSANKDIPPSQSAALSSPQGMHFEFECNPPVNECSMDAMFEIIPVEMDGNRLESKQVTKTFPRFERNQFLLSERRLMLRFLRGSAHVNCSGAHVIRDRSILDYDPDTETARITICVPIRNCGGTPGKGDTYGNLKLYWSVYDWGTGTYAVYPQHLSNRGTNGAFYSDSPIQPGDGMLVERSASLNVESGRYEVRVHQGPQWHEHPLCSISIRFDD